MEVDDDDMDIDDSRVVRVVGLSRKVLRELSSESEEWLTEMSMADESSGLSDDPDYGGELNNSGEFVDASEVDDHDDGPNEQEMARRWASEVAKVKQLVPSSNSAVSGASGRNGRSHHQHARANAVGKDKDEPPPPLIVKPGVSAPSIVAPPVVSPTPLSSSSGNYLAPTSSSSMPPPSNAASMLMSRREGRGHKRGQGSLAPVLDRISGSASDIPTVSGPGGGAEATPNTRRLLSSPGEWLKQAINPNTADPAFVQSFKKNKVKREFNHVHLLQEVQGHAGAIWTSQISPDGRFFISAGKDLKINLYKIAAADDGTNNILHHRCTFEGHVGDVYCVSWAQNSESFVSSSMDKTVRLWKIPSKVKNTKDCESHTVSENVVFEHSDFVTSVAFHPNNEWFVSGCFDKKLRVWSVRDRAVLFWVDLASFITSVALASAGAMVICGDHEGKATLFQTEGLRWITQIHVRSRHGRNSKGKKISGIRVMPDQESFLVTSNDSRVRLFRLSDFGLVCKYKGIQNDFFQIVATPSESGEHIICGSEVNNVVVWNTHKRSEGLSFSLTRQKFAERKDRNRSYEFWRCSDAAVTVALFLPAASRALVIPQGMGEGGISEGSPDTSLIITCDETGKIVCFENRKRLRKHVAVARGFARGSSRNVSPMMSGKSPALSRTSSVSSANPPTIAPPPSSSGAPLTASFHASGSAMIEEKPTRKAPNLVRVGSGGASLPGSRPTSQKMEKVDDSSDDSL